MFWWIVASFMSHFFWMGLAYNRGHTRGWLFGYDAGRESAIKDWSD